MLHLLTTPLLVAAAQTPAPPHMNEDPAAAGDLRSFAEAHCLLCHEGEDPDGDFDLAGLLEAPDLEQDRERWLLVRSRVARGEMPPASEPRPPAEDLARFVELLTTGLELDAGGPGRVTLRRLNRTEYENTVLDLFGVEVDAARTLPRDGVGHGFDNIGDVLSMPPFLLERYLETAEEVARGAVLTRADARPGKLVVTPEDLNKERARGGLLRFTTNGREETDVQVKRGGRYTFRARATAQQAGDEDARMELVVDGKVRARKWVKVVAPELAEYEVEVELAPGKHRVGCGFLNDYYKPDHPDASRRDRNLHVESLELVGPLDAWDPTPFQVELLEEAEGDVERALALMARRVWRRPVDKDEVRRLRALSERDAEPEVVLQNALVGLLVSPHFLYLVEVDPEGAVAARDLTPHELAARLSYFLWRSAPDRRLDRLADAGTLTQPDVLRAEVERLLDDARSRSLATGFAEQWLQVRSLEDAQPDPIRFETYSAELREAMLAETRLFFESVLREKRSVWTLLSADYTFLNDVLAEHYGIAGVRGSQMRRVAVPEPWRGRRGGVLTHASVLTSTSNPTRTSAVLRGKWVLEALLAAPPPPPPPGLGALDDSQKALRAKSLREQLEAHRSDPACAACHETMDVLGFGLENYDAIGAWRDADGPHPIDASGVLPGGRAFEGPEELVGILREDPRFLRALYENLLVYALGRGLTPADGPAVEAALEQLPSDPTLAEMIHLVVSSSAFLQRLPEAP